MKKKWILGIMLSLCLGLIGGMVALTYDFSTPTNQTEEQASEADTFPLDWLNELFEGGGSTMVNYTEFRFEKTAPAGFVYKGTLASASNIKVYINETKVAFVDSNTIYAQDGFNFMDYMVDYPVNYIFNNFDTSNVTLMVNMFQGCYIGEIDLKSFNTANVTDFSYMFQDAIITNVLDLSNFVINEGAIVDGMLDLDTNHEHMKILVTPKTVKTEISITTGSALFDGSTGASKTSITTSDAGKAFVTADSGYFMPNWKTWLAEQNIGITLYSLSGAVIEFPTTTHISFEKEIPSGYNDTGKAMASGVKLYQSSTTATDIAFVFNGTIYAPVSCNQLFSGYNFRHTIIFNNFNTSLVTDMSYMFSMSMGNRVTYLDLSNFDTSNVTNMIGMFYSKETAHDTYIESIDLSSFDTSNVTDMSNMFSGTPVKNLDLSSFNTSNVTNMQAMFNRASQLKKLDLSNFDTSKCDGCWVGNILYGGTFAGCTNLEILNLSGIVLKDKYNNGFSKLLDKDSNLKIVVAPKSMASQIDFYNNKSMIEVSSGMAKTAIATSDTGKVFVSADSGYFMPSWKTWLANQSVGVTYSTATSIKFLSTAPDGYTDTGKTMDSGIKLYQSSTTATDIAFVFGGTIYAPVSCYQLFQGCVKLTSFTFDNFDTQLVTAMHEMFYNCRALTNLDLRGFDTSKVTSTWKMFCYCESLTSLNLSSFNTSKMTSMSTMFYYCKALTSLDLSNFDTSNVTSMYQMFDNCSALTELNVSSFDTSKVTDMRAMFVCPNLKTLDISNFVIRDDVTFKDGTGTHGYYLPNIRLLKTPKSVGTEIKLSTNNILIDSETRERKTSILTTDANKTFLGFPIFPTTWKTDLASASVGVTYSTVTEIHFSKTAPDGFTDTEKKLGTSDISIYTNGTAIAFVCADTIYSPASSKELFESCSKLTTIVFDNFNTSITTDMSKMFSSCASLTSLDLSNFDTSNVTSMSSMFGDCFKMTSLNLSSFDTSNVKTMAYMFIYCKALESLDLSSFNTSNVTTMYHMFYSCSALSSLNVSSFNTAKVTTMGGMFSQCSNLTDLNLNNFNTASVTNMESMFSSCSKMTTLNISSFDTSSVTTMYSMFYYCQNLTELNLSSFDTSSVTTMYRMFNGCSKLTELNLSNFDTSSVTDMSQMFSECSSLTNLNIDNFNTSNVTTFGDMFYFCTKLTELNLGSFDTSKATNISMFRYCSGLKTLDLRNFDTSKVTGMGGMFSGCVSLVSVDLSSFNTSNVTHMGNMFYNCSSLTTLDLSNFVTSKVTSMNSMFSNCSSLTTLDLSNFDTSKVTDMGDMFYKCNKLVSVNVSSFNTENVTKMTTMFYDCQSLIKLDLSSFTIGASTTLSSYMGGLIYANNLMKLVTPKNVGQTVKFSTRKLYDTTTGDVKTSIATTDAGKVFAAKIDLTVDADGGECNASTVGVYYDTPIGESGMASLPTPTKKGAEFLGWRKNYFDTVEFMNHFNNYGNELYRDIDEYKSTLIDYKKLKMFGNRLGYKDAYEATSSQSLNSNKIEANAGFEPGLVQGGSVYIYWKPTTQLIAGKYRLTYSVELLNLISSDKGSYASIVPIKKSGGSFKVVNKYGEAYIDASTCTLASGANTSESATSSCSAIYEVDSNFLGFILQGGYSAYFENIKFELIETADGSDYPAEAKVSSESSFNTVQSISAIWKIMPVDVTVKVMTSGSESVSGLGSASVTYVNATGSASSIAISASTTTFKHMAGNDLSIKISAGSGYVYIGSTTDSSAPKPIVKPADTAEFLEVADNTTIYIWFKKASSFVLKYDETDKYFYFEGGLAPQTYVGDSMNATLNDNYVDQTSMPGVCYGSIRGFSGIWSGDSGSIYETSYLNNKYAGIVANKTQTLTLNGASVSVVAGVTYWFKVETIRWRVSDYGVSSTDYPEGWGEYGSYNENIVAVSDKLIWANSLTNSKYAAGAGWSNSGEKIGISSGFYDQSGTVALTDKLNQFSDEKDVSVPSSKESVTYLASESQVRKYLSDIRAKATDFVAFVLEIDSDEYARYWLSDLGSKYYNVKSVGANGNIKDAWTTNLLGCRLVINFNNASRL